MSARLVTRTLALVAALVFLAIGCSNPGDEVTLDVPPVDSYDTISGDSWFDALGDLLGDAEDDTPCVPDCNGKECGDDGCGGTSCGKCTGDLVCSADFLCVPDCDAACEGLTCGDGGTDGACDCGACEPGYACSNEGTCSAACGELCDGLECGVAGEDGECDCGGCDEHYMCVDGSCEVDCDAACAMAECTPEWAMDLCDCGSCDDGNPCTDDSCQVDGSCTFAGLDGIACDDGDACTTEGLCQSGVCVAQPVVCDDENPCTDDACDADTGECVFAPNNVDCDDGDVCTVGDECGDGLCAGTPVDCQCETDADCDKLEDGDLCNGTLYCDTTLVQQICKVNPATVVECPEPDADDPDAPCLQPSCEPETGECGLAEDNEGFPCADANLCDVADYCEKGLCVGGVDANCNDGNLCTDDACDPMIGCVQTPNEDPCEDGDPCTIGDQCVDGACVHGPPPVCDDGNPCTDELCDSQTIGGCIFVNNLAECDDGDTCTLNDACLMGACVGTIPLPCDDFNVCTDDSCDPIAGCINTPNTSVCDDDDPCTVTDVCAAGLCVGSGALDCDDDNDCTADLCEPGAGCVFLPTFGPCDDENACTWGDTCVGGVCEASKINDCDDGNPCTTDSCDPILGCVNAPNVLPCNDGDACTLQDTCQGGTCHGTIEVVCQDENPCTADLCDSHSGCQFVAVDGQCDDGNACTTGDLCTDGICGGGATKDCNDFNVCTDDSCEPTTGCVNTANTAPCNDGNPCTFPDICGDGVCGGADVSCDDGNPCTDDMCDPAAGCTHAFNTAPCDDLSQCTTEDLCAQGICAGQGSLECDDGNLCTLDICLPDGGCDYELLSDLPCSDGDACTLNDHCVDGQCTPGETPDCDDDNPCTEDACEEGLCENTPAPDVECDDGNACTTGDFCDEDGECVSTGLEPCDDENACTDDWCDPLDGCQSAPNDLACTDGNACTLGDMCTDGQCAAGEAVDCDDGNPCTDDSCDPAKGCVNAPNSNECDDGNICTTGDMCVAGVCTAAGALPCDDENSCTVDTCDPVEGCVHVVKTGSCSDGDSCTTGDLCVDGQCVAGPPLVCDDGNPCTDDSCLDGQCVFAPNAAACDDGNACTLGDHCGGGQCIYEDLVVCNDDNPCTVDSCDPAEGCDWTLSDAPCSDGDACTLGDQCIEGLCVPGEAQDCDDDNACTDDWCDPTTGCVFTPNVDPCDDLNPCTLGDFCDAGLCASGQTEECDDGNVCTSDWCDPNSGCKNENNGFPCTDGNPCTQNDECTDGACVGFETDCDDGNPCTDDSCDPATGCVSTFNEVACDDQNDCTVDDVCNAGLCQGTGSLECDDDNICTKDICLPDGGCDHELLTGTPCSDDNLCTSNDSCLDGECAPGEQKDCDDSNACTDDACDPVFGWCNNTPSENTECSDGNACTEGDACVEGECVYGAPVICDDGNPCTQDSCDPSQGCMHAAVDGLCSDGDACTTGDLCVEGVCLGQGELACDDGNACTDDTCDTVEGCVYTPSGDLCTDGNACTEDDYCMDGACISGAPVSCDDQNACTSDACDPDQGCVYTNVNNPCSDFDACTIGDKCLGGVCTPSGTLGCDDGNPCTDDSCDADEGCINAPNQDDCTDGSLCTVGDQCLGGECVPGPAPECDDENVCTDDLCDPQSGCVNKPNFDPCTDDNACTVGDACVQGECVIAGELDCDDDNPCTDDSCDPEVGCVNVPNQGDCDDGNACTTGDHCVEAACVYTGLANCDDKNVCTTDSCDPGEGCIHAPNTEPCDDMNACTSGDKCAEGQCASGMEIVCDDQNVCTDDTCDPLSGCTFTANSASCDDQNECTTGDACMNGECHGVGSLECDDENQCTKDICLPDGGCENVPLTDTLCTDGDPCTIGDVCVEGVCDAGEPLVCNDGNVCTDDACVGGQCKFTANEADCSDGNACTLGDHCADGACVYDMPKSCDDENVCTTDGCDPAEGCFNTPNQNLCDDMNACTSGDHCADGQCVPEGVVTCNDGNICTTDACDEDGGCVFTPNDNECTDNDICTTDDTCSDGACLPGPPMNCNDEVECTIDSCVPSLGCQHLALDALCNDDNTCTIDACDMEGGCSNTNQPVDCVMGQWTPWSPCSEECGGGERMRSREIEVPMLCDGTPCGPVQEIEACNTQPCQIDCEWHWGPWGECEGGCPEGSQKRFLVIDVEPMYGGEPCPEGDAAFQEQTCSMVSTPCDDQDACTLMDTCTPSGCLGTDALTVPLNQGGCDDGLDCTIDTCDGSDGQMVCANTNQPVDCVVGGWSDWGTCEPGEPGTCSGSQLRTRKILVAPECDGASCPTLEELQDCAVASGTACSDAYPCTAFEACDGDGGCSGGVPVDGYCDDDEVCTSNVCDPSSSLADKDGCVYTNVPVDCVMGPWTDWSVCDAECDGGSQFRIREIEIENSCGGAECGDDYEEQDCNTQPCCVPETCDSLGAECGVQDDGCDGTLQCGTCDDEDDCTDDTCDAGTCVYTDLVEIPEADGGCDDGDACTADTCGEAQTIGGTTPYQDGYPSFVEMFGPGGCYNLDELVAGRIVLTEETTITALAAYFVSLDLFYPDASLSLNLYAGDGDFFYDLVACATTPAQGLQGEVVVDLDAPVTLPAGTYWLTAVVPGFYEIGIDFGVPDAAIALLLGGEMPCECATPDSFFDVYTELEIEANYWVVADGGCANTNVPVDCEGAWSDWSTCSQTDLTCAGTQSRTFTISTPASCNGNACQFQDQQVQTQSCTMPAQTDCDDESDCTIDDLCDSLGECTGTNVPVDCVGAWSDWSTCSQTDDTCAGTQGRTFTISTPASCGGTACQFQDQQTQEQTCTMPADTSCDDGDDCTALDVCDGNGDCAGTDATEVPVADGGCDDGDDCTTDTCSTETVWGYEEPFPGGGGQGIDGMCFGFETMFPAGMITVESDTTIDTIGAWLEYAEGQVRLGVYSGDINGPQELIVCSGLVDAPDGGLLEASVTPTLLPAGTYWIVLTPQMMAGLISQSPGQGVSAWLYAFGLGDQNCAENSCAQQWDFPDVDTARTPNVYVKGGGGGGGSACAYEDVCTSEPVINEVDYDQAGTDTLEFVEIYNPGTSGVDLGEYTLELVNGNGGAVYDSVALNEGLGTDLLAAGELLVVGSPGALALVPQSVKTIALPGAIQNGEPDGVRIVDAQDALIDGLAYEGAMVGTGEGDYAPADLSDSAASLVRCPDGADTDDNWTDFELVSAPSAGILNSLYGCNNLVPVDCEVSAWGQWGTCSETCGGGTQTRTRTVVLAAKNGGEACPELEETQACNEDPCPAACCVQGACQLLTPTACQDANGSWSGEAACDPDPCAAGVGCEKVIDLGQNYYFSVEGDTTGGVDDFSLTPGGQCSGPNATAGNGAPDLIYSFTPEYDYLFVYLYEPGDAVQELTFYVVSDCEDPSGSCVTIPTQSSCNTNGCYTYVDWYNFPLGQYYIIVDGIEPGNAGAFQLWMDFI